MKSSAAAVGLMFILQGELAHRGVEDAVRVDVSIMSGRPQPSATVMGTAALQVAPSVVTRATGPATPPAGRGASLKPGPTVQPAIQIPLPSPAAGKVQVTIAVEGGRPRPVFAMAFSDAKGEWISPPASRGGRGTLEPAQATDFVLAANPPSFSIDLPPGAHRPIVNALPAGYTLRSMLADGKDVKSQPITVAAGSKPVELTVSLGVTQGPPWVRVRGRVVDVANAQADLDRKLLTRPMAVILSSPAFSEHFNAPIARDGSFEFPAILPGVYGVWLTPIISSSPSSVVVGEKDLLNVELKVQPSPPQPAGRGN